MVVKRGAEQSRIGQVPAIEKQGKADEAYGVIGVLARQGIIVDANPIADLLSSARRRSSNDTAKPVFF